MTVCNMSIEGARGRAWWRRTTRRTRICMADPMRHGRPVGSGAPLLEDAAVRSGCGVRPRRHVRGRRDGPHGHVGHEPPGRAADHRPSPRSERDRRCRAPGRDRARARLHGTPAGHAAHRGEGGPRLHRLVHQQPPRATCARPPRWSGAGAPWCPAWVVPGSGLVKRAAEAEGLDRVFVAAGLEWREPGCSMCVGMNGDLGRAGERIASTSNRNFEGRQGQGVRTHLMSPAMAAAAAVTGRLTDVRACWTPALGAGEAEETMEPFTTLTAVAVPIDLPNVDTDRIIPARFLRRPGGRVRPLSVPRRALQATGRGAGRTSS